MDIDFKYKEKFYKVDQVVFDKGIDLIILPDNTILKVTEWFYGLESTVCPQSMVELRHNLKESNTETIASQIKGVVAKEIQVPGS